MKINNYNFNLKYVFFLIIYTSLIFIDNIYISIFSKEIIEIDNKLEENFYENDIKFYKNKTKLKPIAFYYPEYNNISYFKYFNRALKKDNINKDEINQLINKQIKLARNHQIYGFAIFYSPFDFNKISRITMDFFFNKIKFPFFLIWRNDEINNIDKYSLSILINNLSKYLISSNYIKFNGKPILSINNPRKISKRIRTINTLRKLFYEKVGNLFLIYPYSGNYSKYNFFREFDAIYDFSKVDLFKEIINRPNILYYSGFVYKNLILNNLDINFQLFRTCYVNYNIDYKPEKFYIQNKILLQTINDKFELNHGIIFIDSWNDYSNRNYLEFDERFGYSSINSFSKSILNLSYKTNNFIIDNNNFTMIAIHIHVYYEELFSRILRRVNLIPMKYDLFISTVSNEKKLYIENLLINSNHNKYEIKIFENIGRDIYPFLSQMRHHFKHYKYICHLHTKKSMHKRLLGSNWSEYIYNNLLGNKEIISDIIYEFEYNKKLGIIFPEPYYEIIKGVKNFYNINLALHRPNKELMNDILKTIFHKYIIGEKLIFPVGNMFWAKIKAIFQIFYLKLNYPDELSQTNETIMHALERLWLYLVKLNGYEYKMVFNHY